jgi:hypothetical protein
MALAKIGMNRSTAALVAAGLLLYNRRDSLSLTQGWTDLQAGWKSIATDGFQTDDITDANATVVGAAAAGIGAATSKRVGAFTAGSLALGMPMLAIGTMLGSGPNLLGGGRKARRYVRARRSMYRANRRRYGRRSSFRRAMR